MIGVGSRQQAATGISQGTTCPACLFSLESSNGSLRMRTCPSCRTVSAWPLPSKGELAAYYNTDYTVVDAGLTQRGRRNWTPLLEEAERCVTGRRGLELGSSNGQFLRLALERGWAMVGVELDGRAREEHARSSPSIPAWETLAAAAAAGATALDAVWAFHTIEHLPAPESTLREILGMLAPGGALIATMPNGACLERRILGELWEWWTPPAHLTLFSPRGGQLLLERVGFEVCHVATRRGDSAGAAANLLLAPARLLKRRLSRGVQQRSHAASATQRMAAIVNRFYDPLSGFVRSRLYRRRLLGPELLVVARRPDHV